jgi:rhamnose utilization protein RhaD (predicted bifunctional aldolase and dehydrogenase)
MLVQGAGGNVSWKDGETLWIKASGTWLSDAARKDIFVPTDLTPLQQALAARNFAVIPSLRVQSDLRPSIETLLHALMPHPVVVHLHPIEVLAHLVRPNFEADVKERLGDSVRWVSTGYRKPGAPLAEAVAVVLAKAPEAQVILLQNHGVVIGGASLAEVDGVLCTLVAALATPQRPPVAAAVPDLPLSFDNSDPYLPVPDPAIHQLAIDTGLFDRLPSDWALYPDHVVFLGARPFCYASVDELRMEHKERGVLPEMVFVRGSGVFTKSGLSAAKQAQLRCYYDVLSRQSHTCRVSPLADNEIAELLNWDAEQYRMHMAK